MIASQGMTLCLQRADVSDFWQSVTGSLQQDEMPYQAAMRELEEETGLTIRDGELKDCQQSWWFEIYPHWLHRYPPGTTHNLEHVFVFTCHSNKPVRLSGEHLSYEWLPKAQAIDKVGSHTNKQALRLFL